MIAQAASARRCFVVPEVVQTSAMDCGPASLTSLIEGFGIPLSYGRLREACQTDVDGTSINTMEEVALQLGLEAEQVMLPADHILLPETRALPAIVVMRRPTGEAHFSVVWRRHGRLVQVMDPAQGRRWPTCDRLLSELYVHELRVPAADWREWAQTDEFLAPLQRRLQLLGLSKRLARGFADEAVTDGDWHALATLDAATRMLDSLVRSGGIRRGRQAGRVLRQFIVGQREDESADVPIIPSTYWAVRQAPSGPEDEPGLLVRGAVLVRAGRPDRTARPSAPSDEDRHVREPAPLSPELAAALKEPPSRPWAELLRTLRADGMLAPMVILGALMLAASGIVVEALLFRGFLEMGRSLGLGAERLGAITALVIFAAALLALELPIAAGLLRAGRGLETRLRLAFLRKIPRLTDRYFHSRPISDMVERCHSVQLLRFLPTLGGQFLRATFALVLTTAAIAWLDPESASLAAAAAFLSVAFPLAAQPFLAERELRVRTHFGALGRFYLDALLGIIPVRTHGAERSIRREHESLLVEWIRAGLRLQRSLVCFDGVMSLIGFGLVAWLVFDHIGREGVSGSVLLLVYWALNLPALGQEVALVARQYPGHRNITLRLLEPLGALEEPPSANPSPDGDTSRSTLATDGAHSTSRGSSAGPRTSAPSQRPDPNGSAGPTVSVSIQFESVTVRAGGHTILQDIDLSIPRGTHAAIIGPSGAGKSTLLGLLLGWHKASAGRVLVDGIPPVGDRLVDLRRQTAWVDPAVHLWNRSFIENLQYGTQVDLTLPLGRILDYADLHTVLESFPEGLQTPLGEGGSFISGGEGQRVRLGRALLRPNPGLVILDEPFRGLDREKRRKLLASARRWWHDATLLCITHDVADTRSFDQVILIEDGRVVENGAPSPLADRADSRYRAVLEAEEAVCRGLWVGAKWRSLWLEGGTLKESKRRAES